MSQAVTSPISTDERSGQTVQYPVAANTNLYTGGIGAINSSGNATFAQDAAGLIVGGRIEADALNGSGSAGAVSVNLKRSVFRLLNSTRSAGEYALTQAMVGQACYIEDDQTVQAEAGSTHKVKAGIFLGIDANNSAYVWVDMRFSGSVGATIPQTQNSITDDSTGTAAAPSGGVRTIAAVSSVGTAANAVADIAAELNLIRADIANILSVI